MIMEREPFRDNRPAPAEEYQSTIKTGIEYEKQ